MLFRLDCPCRHLHPAAVAACVLGVLAASAAPAAAGVNFAPPANYTAHSFPQSIAIGDLNGDGIPDLAVANNGGASSGDVSVLLGAGAGSFSPATNYSAQPHPESIAIGDLNADGIPDLAVANSSTNDVSVLLGTGGCSCKAASNFVAHSTAFSVAIGDLNGDGKPDLAVANFNSTDVSVLLNTTSPGTTTPTFATAANFGAHSLPESVAIGDINGDGKPDLAAANAGTADVSVLLNTTASPNTLSFNSAVNFGAHSQPISVAIGDLNGDGRPDLAVANNASSDVAVLLNTTQSGQTTPFFGGGATDFAADRPNAVAIGDLNGDGKPDLAVANMGSTVSVLLNGMASGALTPAFGAAAIFGADGVTKSLAIGDLNGDGIPDLAVADGNPGDVSVLLNAPTADRSPVSLTFGSFASPVPQGTVSAPKTVTVTNNGSSPLVVAGFAVSGTNPDDFFTSDDSCHGPVAPGASCTAHVRFAPQAQGSRSGTLTVLTNAPTDPTVSLAGTAGPLPQGPPGPRGPTGPRGTAGHDAKVTCTVTKAKGTSSTKVTCKVVLVHKTGKRGLRWRLVRHGRTVAHGVAHAHHHRIKLRLSDLARLHPGRYTLRVAGRRHGTTFVIR